MTTQGGQGILASHPHVGINLKITASSVSGKLTLNTDDSDWLTVCSEQVLSPMAESRWALCSARGESHQKRNQSSLAQGTETQTVCDFNLIFVQLTVLILFLSLLLKCDDDDAHEDVHHEECNDDDVDDEEDGDLHAIVVDGAHILSVRVDGFVQQPGEQRTSQHQPCCLLSASGGTESGTPQ